MLNSNLPQGSHFTGAAGRIPGRSGEGFVGSFQTGRLTDWYKRITGATAPGGTYLMQPLRRPQAREVHEIG